MIVNFEGTVCNNWTLIGIFGIVSFLLFYAKNTSLTSDKELNILLYWTPSYVNIRELYTVENGAVFWPTLCILALANKIRSKAVAGHEGVSWPTFGILEPHIYLWNGWS